MMRIKKKNLKEQNKTKNKSSVKTNLDSIQF